MKTLLTILLFLLFWFGNTSDILAQAPDKLFQQGMMLEVGDGNLKGAIEIYSKLVTDVSASRYTQANALLHVGICYEKLGSPDSKLAYQRLISEYAEQDEIIAIGKSKLKEFKDVNPVLKNVRIVATQVWSPAEDTYGVSPNGRYLNYIDWNNISLNIKDLKKGTTRVLSKAGTWKRPMEFPDNSIWSPDGKKIAYYWFVGKDVELHVVNFDGSSDKILVKGKNGTTPWPVRWSPDGNFILAIKSNNENKLHEIVLVSTLDGSIKSFKTLDDCGCYMDISPDNKYIVYTLPQNENSLQKDIHIISMDGTIDKKIVDDASNDASPIWSNNGKEILFVSDRYGSNDLWKLKIEKGNPIGTEEIVKVNLGSKNSLLGISNNGTIFYTTTNTRNDIYTINLEEKDGSRSDEKIKVSSIEEKMNIRPIWSPDGRYIAYYRAHSYRDNLLGRQHLLTILDTKTGILENIDTGIYGATFSKPTWSPDGKKLLFFGIIEEKLQAGLFSLDILSKKINPIKVKQNMSRQKAVLYNNYMTYSNDGKSIYYLSEDFKRILNLNLKSKQESTIISGNDVILYFKLSNDNSRIALGYWYENNKDIYVVSTKGGEKKKIFETDCACSPNVISWSKDDKFLYFKKGKFRDLKEIMRVSVDGGNPELFFDFKEVFNNGTIINADVYLDGNKLLVELMVGKGAEVWKLEGVFDE